MATIETVLGPIDTSQMGRCLIHEHVVVTDWNLRMNVRGWCDEEVVSDRAAERIRLQKEQFGVDTIGDLTTWGLGRDVKLMAKIAEKADVNVLCATGTYGDDTPYFRNVSMQTVIDYMLDDINNGIQGTSIKPAMLKVATMEKGVNEHNEKLLRATAKVHLETGVPIFTHTYPHNGSGLAQQDIFEDEGVDLRGVVIGHCGDSNDVDYIESILKRGSFVGLDRFSQNKHNPHEDRMKTAIELFRRGWYKQIILSHDHLVYCDYDLVDRMPEVDLEAEEIDLRYIDRFVIPGLLEAGVPQEQIDFCLYDNPRRIFEKDFD